MRNVNAVFLFIGAAAVNTAGFLPIYYIPLYFQFTRGDGAIGGAIFVNSAIDGLSGVNSTDNQRRHAKPVAAE